MGGFRLLPCEIACSFKEPFHVNKILTVNQKESHFEKKNIIPIIVSLYQIFNQFIKNCTAFYTIWQCINIVALTINNTALVLYISTNSMETTPLQCITTPLSSGLFYIFLTRMCIIIYYAVQLSMNTANNPGRYTGIVVTTHTKLFQYISTKQELCLKCVIDPFPRTNSPFLNCILYCFVFIVKVVNSVH